jgi:hypothetical protein
VRTFIVSHCLNRRKFGRRIHALPRWRAEGAESAEEASGGGRLKGGVHDIRVEPAWNHTGCQTLPYGRGSDWVPSSGSKALMASPCSARTYCMAAEACCGFHSHRVLPWLPIRRRDELGPGDRETDPCVAPQRRQARNPPARSGFQTHCARDRRSRIRCRACGNRSRHR